MAAAPAGSGGGSSSYSVLLRACATGCGVPAASHTNALSLYYYTRWCAATCAWSSEGGTAQGGSRPASCTSAPLESLATSRGLVRKVVKVARDLWKHGDNFQAREPGAAQRSHSVERRVCGSRCCRP